MLEIPLALAEDIRQHAREAHPEECAGALLGTLLGGARYAVRLENAGPPRAGYRIFAGPAQVAEVVRIANERTLELLGFYHSHPNGEATPSEYDLAHATGCFSYVVVAGNEIRSWTLNANHTEFREEPVLIGGESRGHSQGLSKTNN